MEVSLVVANDAGCNYHRSLLLSLNEILFSYLSLPGLSFIAYICTRDSVIQKQGKWSFGETEEWDIEFSLPGVMVALCILEEITLFSLFSLQQPWQTLKNYISEAPQNYSQLGENLGNKNADYTVRSFPPLWGTIPTQLHLWFSQGA